MKRAALGVVVFAAVLLLSALPAGATFHIIVIDQVFAGFEPAPDAQYVMLRTEFNAQINVHGRAIAGFDQLGNPVSPFAAFCSTPVSQCNLPSVSPACAAGDCPAIPSNDRRILIATARARDLFCVTPDLLATGTLPASAGRVCFADTDGFSASCSFAGPVDCVAYGDFSGDNAHFGTPAAAPAPGEALVGSAERLAQCSPSLHSGAVCVGGDAANMACGGQTTECPNGTCVQCPGGNCGNLLDSEAGFSPGPPTPQNFHGDTGDAGLAGDPEGSGMLGSDNVGAETDVLFEFDRRCAAGLAANRRGADANFDTRISAADVIATIQIIRAAPAAAAP